MRARTLAKSMGLGAATLATAYGIYVARTWRRYGLQGVKAPGAETGDTLMDHLMPIYEICQYNEVQINAPMDVTFAAARELDLEQSFIAKSLFKGRKLLLRGRAPVRLTPRGLVATTQSLGWAVLAKSIGEEIVLGAVTQPWVADAVFRPISPSQFRSFSEPDYTKIIWNLRVEAQGPDRSRLITETRVANTNDEARRKFRLYWAFLSPGIFAIRRVMLRAAKAEAERKALQEDRTKIAKAG